VGYTRKIIAGIINRLLLVNPNKKGGIMRKLKLQMQLSVDGFVAGPQGELDWMVWDWDDKLKAYVNVLMETVDTILMGRKMTDGFIAYWSDVMTKPDHPDYPFGKKMMDTPKIVFSHTLKKSHWKNTAIAKDSLVDEISKLKKQAGNDIIVYGGAGFVSSLVNNNLIDHYHLFINPAAIGKGMTIFKDLTGKLSLNLIESRTFSCGIVVNHYQPGP